VAGHPVEPAGVGMIHRRRRPAAVYTNTVRGALRHAFSHAATFSVHTDVTGPDWPRVAVRWSGEPSVEQVRAALAPFGFDLALKQD